MRSVDRRRGLLDGISPTAAAAMDDWAEWIRQNRDIPGGPTTSISYRMMQAKLLGVAAYGTGYEPQMPDRLLIVDSGVAHLPRRLKRAFRVFYLWYASAEDKARGCRCDTTTFYRRVKRARRIVANFVESSEITL